MSSFANGIEARCKRCGKSESELSARGINFHIPSGLCYACYKAVNAGSVAQESPQHFPAPPANLADTSVTVDKEHLRIELLLRSAIDDLRRGEYLASMAAAGDAMKDMVRIFAEKYKSKG